jgi:hypothetical protein
MELNKDNLTKLLDEIKTIKNNAKNQANNDISNKIRQEINIEELLNAIIKNNDDFSRKINYKLLLQNLLLYDFLFYDYERGTNDINFDRISFFVKGIEFERNLNDRNTNID